MPQKQRKKKTGNHTQDVVAAEEATDNLADRLADVKIADLKADPIDKGFVMYAYHHKAPKIVCATDPESLLKHGSSLFNVPLNDKTRVVTYERGGQVGVEFFKQLETHKTLPRVMILFNDEVFTAGPKLPNVDGEKFFKDAAGKGLHLSDCLRKHGTQCVVENLMHLQEKGNRFLSKTREPTDGAGATAPPGGAKFYLDMDAAEIIDERDFEILPDFTNIMCLKEGDTFPAVSSAAMFNGGNRERAPGWLCSHCKVEQVLHNYPLYMEDRRKMDPLWFDSLPDTEKYQLKTQVIKEASIRRLRNYHDLTRSEVKSAVGKCVFEEHLAAFFLELWEKASQSATVKCLSRTETPDIRCCFPAGWFTCDKSIRSDFCVANHLANPYISTDARRAFQTWEYDHIREQHNIRKIIVQAAQAFMKAYTWQSEQAQKDLIRHHHADLYSQGNIRLVHSECHSKARRGEHGEELL